ncbi:MAG: hypothetical protein ABI687_06210, partial [Flavitalea sp.]
MNKTIIRLTAITILIVAIVSMLHFYTTNKNHRKNSFIRLLPSHMLTKMQAIDIKYNSYYIAGLTNDHIYLGNYTSPENILISNYELTDTQQIIYKLSNKNKLVSKDIKIEIDSPTIYITDNIHSDIFFGDLDSKKIFSFKAKSNNIESAFVSPTSIIFRTYDTIHSQSIIGRQNLYSSEVKMHIDILEKQIDGLFCTDGMIIINRNPFSAVYVYYYRNQFILLDTNLNILSRFNTIDTNSTAKIKIGKSSENQTTLLEPPLIVNHRSCSDGNFLYINSSL